MIGALYWSGVVSRQDIRRTIVVPPERTHVDGTKGLHGQALTYFQSFMLLRDVAKQEAARSEGWEYSRFVPPAIIMLHAFMDAQINETLAITLQLQRAILDPGPCSRRPS